MNHLQNLSGGELFLLTLLILGMIGVISATLLSKKPTPQSSPTKEGPALIPKDRLSKEEAMKIVWEKHMNVKGDRHLEEELKCLVEEADGKPGVVKINPFEPDEMREQLMAQYGFDMTDVLKSLASSYFWNPSNEVNMTLHLAVMRLKSSKEDPWRKEQIKLFLQSSLVQEPKEGQKNLRLPYELRGKSSAVSTLVALRREIMKDRMMSIHCSPDPFVLQSYEDLATCLSFAPGMVFERTLNLVPDMLAFYVEGLIQVNESVPLGSGTVDIHQTRPLKVDRIDDDVIEALVALGHEGVHYSIYRSAGMLNIEARKGDQIVLICDAPAYFNYLEDFQDVKPNTLASALMSRNLYGNNDYGFLMCRLGNKNVACYFNTRNITTHQGEPS